MSYKYKKNNKENGEIKMAETTKAFVKKIKGTSQELGELLQANKFEEAFDVANKLNNLLKSEEIDNLTGKELKETNIEGIKEQLKKYWWANGEMRKYQGLLRKYGQMFSDYAN